jgi:putative DNA primase/helicase
MQEPLDDMLQEWVKSRMTPFSMADAAVEALKLSADKLTPAITTRIGLALKRLGCTRDEDRLADDPSRRRLYVTQSMARLNPFAGVKTGKVSGDEPF